MTRDLITQNVVIALLVAGVAWFAFRQYRDWASVPGELSVGSDLILVKVRHIKNGENVYWGKADSASGGRLVLGSQDLTLKWGLGAKTEIAYARMHRLRVEPFGLIKIVMFDVQDEDQFGRWEFAGKRHRHYLSGCRKKA